MRFVVAGSSGLIGTALCRSLEGDGHIVVRLVRRDPSAPGEVCWDDAGAMARRALDGADVVVNLAGAGIGQHRRTRRYRDIILRSRTESVAAIAVMAAESARRPGVLISASGMRFYGIDRGDEVLTEFVVPASHGFLPMVAQASATCGSAWCCRVTVVSCRSCCRCSARDSSGRACPPVRRRLRAGPRYCAARPCHPRTLLVGTREHGPGGRSPGPSRLP
ncbi:MAG: NAD-dependent epimerase/dehydratase family protein [Carbonactinosporaceae bacterium]